MSGANQYSVRPLLLVSTDTPPIVVVRSMAVPPAVTGTAWPELAVATDTANTTAATAVRKETAADRQRTHARRAPGGSGVPRAPEPLRVKDEHREAEEHAEGGDLEDARDRARGAADFVEAEQAHPQGEQVTAERGDGVAGADGGDAKRRQRAGGSAG